jgi:hypothetical protein
MLRALLAASLVVLAAPRPADAAPGGTRAPRERREETRAARDTGARIATEIATLTGVSISPLLGMSVLGAARWLRAPPDARPALPWWQQPEFWGIGLAVLAALFLGDKVPVLRHLVKHLKVAESKLSGLLAAPVLAGLVSDVVGVALDDLLARGAAIVAPPAHAASGGVAASAASGAGEALAFVAALAVAAAVWLLGHAVDVLVLVSPFAPLDWALRTARLAVVGAILAAARTHPAVGVVLAAIVVLVALAVAGWSFRLMVLGSVFSWDFLLGRSHAPSAGGVRAFSGAALPGVRRRTYGRVARVEGRLEFAWRPWLLLRRRRVPIDVRVAIAEGLVSPVVTREGAGALTVARLPPRYRGRAEEIARALGDLPLREPGIVRGARDALAWLRGEATPAP